MSTLTDARPQQTSRRWSRSSRRTATRRSTSSSTTRASSLPTAGSTTMPSRTVRAPLPLSILRLTLLLLYRRQERQQARKLPQRADQGLCRPVIPPAALYDSHNCRALPLSTPCCYTIPSSPATEPCGQSPPLRLLPLLPRSLASGPLDQSLAYDGRSLGCARIDSLS